MDQLVGQVLDNTYRVDKILGQGGMGAVFLARDVALNREVAIKLMHPHIAQQEGFRERFLQEARAIAALEHPGIVPIYTFSRDPQRLYIAMAFLQGQNLRDWLHLLGERKMVISLAESLAIIEQIADALAYAHRRGVFHRDIKPGNIILRPLDAGQTSATGLSYQPVLTDFGLAKLAEGGIHSMTGMAMGTPAYMAPEQCEGLEIDGRADIYALGVVLYEMVTGRVPFNVRTLTEAIRAHTKEPPPPPRSLNPNLPSQVEEVILKAMAKRPQDRYATADLFGQACAAVRRALPREEATLAATQAGQVSLVTMMSQEAPPPAPENAAWPTPPSEVPAGGRIVILGPDGATRTVPLAGRQRITIGRDPSSDVALPSARVSRQHAQITSDGTHFYITDLNSTNSTYLGNTRVLPGITEAWPPSQALRVGDFWLRLELTGSAPAQAPAPVSYVAKPASSAPEQAIAVTIEPAQLTVRPGQAVMLNVRILNRQQQVDHLAPTVENLPAPWAALPDAPLRLAPGDTGTVTLRFAPPLAPTSAAGAHPFNVRVTSQANPSLSAAAPGTLRVEPFHDIRATLAPSIFQAGTKGLLRLANQGNTPERIAITATDPQEALAFAPSPSEVTLPAGEKAEVGFPVRTKTKRPLIGNPITHAFMINAATAEGQGATAQGSLNVRPWLPAWAVPLLTMLALLLCAGAVFAYSTIQKNKATKATATAVAIANYATATANVRGTQTASLLSAQMIAATATGQAQATAAMATSQAQATRQAITAAAMSQEQIIKATQQAAEATAQWLMDDSDGDGLSNKEEMAWGTLPTNRDTDGDTIPDGQEVKLGISPISKDTDGDGLQDNVDPSPGQLPTPTPTSTNTPEASPTPTQTGLPPSVFESGSDLAFSVSTPNKLGTLLELCLRHDNSGFSPDWYVSKVWVYNEDGSVEFPFERWIAADKGDGSLMACTALPAPTLGPVIGIYRVLPLLPLIVPTATPVSGGLVYKIDPKIALAPLLRPSLVALFATYKVEVLTGNVPDGGTSAGVEVFITGTDYKSDWMPLK